MPETYSPTVGMSNVTRANENILVNLAADASSVSLQFFSIDADTLFLPSRKSEQQLLSRHLLRAMISAANSDGHIDAKEQAGDLRRDGQAEISPLTTRPSSSTNCGSRSMSTRVASTGALAGRSRQHLHRHHCWR